jgi:hypothetical protein
MKLPRPYPLGPEQWAEHGIPTDGLAPSGMSDGYWTVLDGFHDPIVSQAKIAWLIFDAG